MRVYRIPYSTNVERVSLALAHKGLAADWVDVGPRDRTDVERVSGQPLVPVLVDGDIVVADSTAILRYLERRHSEPPLWPRRDPRRAEADVFIEWFNRVWKVPPNAVEAERSKREPDVARIEAWGAEIRASLDLFESLLAGRDYLYGDFSVADCVAFPFLKYAVDRNADDDEPFHEILRQFMPLEDRHVRLRAWLARVDAHPRA
jgi:glutathione S-transferase